MVQPNTADHPEVALFGADLNRKVMQLPEEIMGSIGIDLVTIASSGLLDEFPSYTQMLSVGLMLNAF